VAEVWRPLASQRAAPIELRRLELSMRTDKDDRLPLALRGLATRSCDDPSRFVEACEGTSEPCVRASRQSVEHPSWLITS
jgi:hypothetical protein